MKNLSNNNIVHIQNEDVEYMQFKRLLQYPEIQHAYTMDKKQLSFRIYDGNTNILEQSYEKIANELKLNKQDFLKPHQTHTDIVEIVTSKDEKFEDVDGVITDKKDIILCTTSADCTSLLFYDPIRKVIADVHSGWRGTLKKIGQNTVFKMIKEYRCCAEDIICCICPHIKKCHFEVEDDVMQMFKNEFSSMEEINNVIEKGRKIDGIQKYNIDTTRINIWMLEQAGLQEENIIESGICTVCEQELFHSYRVDKELAGRNAAIITLK